MTRLPHLTRSLAAFIAGQTPIPQDIRELGRRHVLDTLASVVACRDLEPAALARRYSLALSGDASANAATILGTRDRAALPDAVFASAMAGHGAEINDFIPSAFVQPGPAIVSAALALAERRDLTGEAVLRAVVIGYEVAGRIPKALGIDNLRRAGIANHGLGPLFGTAAAAAHLIGLSEDGVGDALTYCAQQASGSWQWLLDVEHIEKSFVFAGLGARGGLHAALMAEAGFRGVRDCLDLPGGWMTSALFSGGDGDPNYLVEGLGRRWELPLTAYKRFPVGGPTQPAVQGLLELLPSLDPSTVDQVVIAMPGRWQAFRDAAMPALNLRYLAAIILLDGRLDFVSAQSLERMHGDAAAKALMQKVTIQHDPAQEAARGSPRTESARVTVTLTGGGTHETYVPFVLGFPSHPMAQADVDAKAMDLLTPHLGTTKVRAVVTACGRLETLSRAADLVDLIAR